MAATIDVPTEEITRQLASAIGAGRLRLDDSALPTGPGVYALFHIGIHPLYSASTEQPIYVGKAQTIRSRLRTHQRSLTEAVDLDASGFVAAAILVNGPAVASLCEELLIERFHPVWNETPLRGFGSHPQGSRRTSQAPSPWDRLHPGRTWVSTPRSVPCPELHQLAKKTYRSSALVGCVG